MRPMIWTHSRKPRIELGFRRRGRGSFTVDDICHHSRSRRHHDHPIGQEHRLGNAVGDEQGGLAPLAPDPKQFEVHVLPRHEIERTERLIHQQQGWIVHQRAADGGTLLHAARKLSGIVMAKVDQPGQLQEVERSFPALRPRQMQHFDRQHHVVENGRAT